MDLSATISEPLSKVASIGAVQRMFVAPDGDLSTIPIELLNHANGRMLIEDFGITYLSTGGCPDKCGKGGYRRDGAGRPCESCLQSPSAHTVTG